MNILELSPQDTSRWEDTKSLFQWTCPGFRHLFYTLLSNNNGKHIALFTDDPQVPIAATDGKNIMINPATFFKFPLKQRVFVLAHEIMHCVYLDAATGKRARRAGELRYPDGATLAFNEDLWQRSMDYRINDALVNSHIGEMPERDGKKLGCYDPKIGTSKDSVYDIYRKLWEDGEGQGNAPGQGPIGMQPGFDTVLGPGESTGDHQDSAAAQQDPQAWATGMAVAQQLESMKSQGKISADLQRMFDAWLKPQVPWTEHIRGFFNRRLGSGGYDWRRPDRRLIIQDIYAPSRSGHGVNWVAVWGDTSGSISKAELNKYFAELAGLIEDLRPRKVTVFWCDSRIKFTDEITDPSDLVGIHARGVGGGGGTSCVPVFDAIEEMGYEPPDAFVGLTDGLAHFPMEAPQYPCVWACTTDTAIPFGEVVRIKPGEANEKR